MTTHQEKVKALRSPCESANSPESGCSKEAIRKVEEIARRQSVPEPDPVKVRAILDYLEDSHK